MSLLLVGFLGMQIPETAEARIHQGDGLAKEDDSQTLSADTELTNEVRQALGKLQADLDSYLLARRDGNTESQSRLMVLVNRDLGTLNKLNVATRIKPFKARTTQEFDRALEPFVTYKKTAVLTRAEAAAVIAAIALAVNIHEAWLKPVEFGGDVLPGGGIVRNDRRRAPR